MNPFQRLRQLGQSVWLDFIDRPLIESGDLDRLIADGLGGMTSNPTIFQKAIGKGDGYDDFIAQFPAEESEDSLFERIQVRDVTNACDRFLPLWQSSNGTDGFVSIEVSPSAAHDTQISIDDARRLWAAVDRPNAMVKIPGTREGIPAIEECLAEGININITLLFSVQRYAEVLGAYMNALERRRSRSQPIDRLASVASFFVSRVDTKVDKLLGKNPDLRGQTAIANAKLAYRHLLRTMDGKRWRALSSAGARTQRLLWASTSTKDPAYSDLHYVEALIGPDTVDTMPLETLRAFLDHGSAEPRLLRHLDPAKAHVANLAKLGIDFSKILRELEDEGVQAFAASWSAALSTIRDRRRESRLSGPPP